MWKALAPPLAAFAVSLLVVPESRGQTPVTETIALTFDSIPEGERLLRSFGAPAIDAEGVVVFNADARAQGSVFPFLLILKSTGSGATLTRIPDVPPGFSTDEMDVPFAFFLPSGPIVNAGGTVAFTSLVTAGSSTPAVDILFTGKALNGLNVAARSDELLGAVQSNAPETVTLRIGEFVLNESGAAAFIASWGGSDLTTHQWAVFVPDETGGFVPKVRSGEQAPGTSPGTVFTFFERLVMNVGGDVAFQANLEDGTTGIWRIGNGQVDLVARMGSPAPGFDEVAFTGFFDMAISPSGEVVFQGRLGRSFTPAGLWSGTNPTDLEAVVVGGLPKPTTLGFDQRFGGPTQLVFTKAGDLLFSAIGSPVESGIWKVVGERVEPIVHSGGFVSGGFLQGDIAPETGESFFRIGDFAANGNGRIAFWAQFPSGLWAQDRTGAFHRVVQIGEELDVRGDTRTVRAFGFRSGPGNGSGHGAAFNDNVALAFWTQFDDGSSGIFRALIDPAPVTDDQFFWTRACGNDNWHSQCSGITNWNDSSDRPQPSPPGNSGDEIVAIAMNSSVGVTLDQEDAQIGKLTALGKLTVRKSLTLNQESTVASLVLDSLESQVVANAKLTLTGDETVFQAGILTINSADGIVNEGIVTVEPFVLTPIALTASKTNAKGPHPKAPPPGTPTFVLDGDGPWINIPPAVNPPQLGRGIMLQNFHILVKDHIGKTAIVNAKGATWHIDRGSLLFGSQGAVPKFTNEGVLSKRKMDPADPSFIDLAYEQKGEGSVVVEAGTLTFRGGGTFEGPGGFVLKSNTSTLRLTSPLNANQTLYQVLSGTVTAASIPPAVSPAVSAVFAIHDRATLSILAGAEFVAELRASADRDRGGFALNDGGELSIKGAFLTKEDFTWRGGKITTSTDTSVAAPFANEGLLSIEGETTLAGRLANLNPIGVKQGVVNLRGTLTLASGGRIENAVLARFNIFDDSKIADAGSDAVFQNKGDLFVLVSDDATADMTATIAARLDNTGHVGVSQFLAPATQTLRVTGGVAQLFGTSLTGGSWHVGHKGVLDLDGATINQIGTAQGARTVVFLGGNAVFRNFELERIGKTGKLIVDNDHSLILPGALNSSGSILVFGDGALLDVHGDFDQRGSVQILSGSAESNATPQIHVHNGDVNFHVGSKTIINGNLKVFTRGKYITVDGDLAGDGNINGTELTVLVEKGRVRVGNSPGTLTIDADYIQSTDGTLEIEIGGTDVGTNLDQLVINGNADLGGTIVFKFIDGFAPRAGDRFDSVAVAGTLAGRFDTVRIVNLAPGFEFEVNNDGGMVSMTALTDGVYTPPDCDQDGDVDVSDFLALTACFTGPGADSLALECSCSDLDNDNDVDLADVIAFQAAFTGAR